MVGKRIPERRVSSRTKFVVTLLATMSILVSAIGASFATAATQTAWIPLNCLLAGVIPAHPAAALTATFPDSVNPGQNFNLTNVSTTVVFPPASQTAAGPFAADAIQGVVSDFETNLTNASASFNPGSSSPTQFNTVGAQQPPNSDAPSPADPMINGGDTTRGGFPGGTPAGTFSFGDIPIVSNGTASANAYGPAPGTGGGALTTSGTPDLIQTLGPMTVTGTAGQNVVVTSAAATPTGNLATNTISFHTASGYTGTLEANCTLDTTADAAPSPDPNFVNQFTIPIVAAAQPPSISGLVPDNGPEAGGNSVVISGANLTGATDVSFGANAATAFTVDNDGQITATAPAGTGTVDVSVTTPVDTSANTAADNYTYNPPAAQPPSISGLVPDNGPEAGGNSVVISGANLTGATDVNFGANAATSFTVDNDGQITATAPAGTGTVDVSVTTPVDTSANTAADNYTYNPPAAQPPSISGLVPDNGPEAGGNSVVISGANLTGATDVNFGANAATSFTVDNDGQITATAPAGTGTVDVSVTTPVDTSANTAADNYTYNPPAAQPPSISGLVPDNGPEAGGNSVVISGANLTGATDVSFGANAATAFTVDNDGQITATAPAGTFGTTVDVSVTTPVDTSANTAADDYTYDARVTSETALAGGTVTSAAEATPSAPVTTAVTTPAAGDVTITESAEPIGSAPSGFSILGGSVQISAPDASVAFPLRIVFTLDASLIPSGTNTDLVTVIRHGTGDPPEGTAAGNCLGSTEATPDPCVTARDVVAGGDLQLTVLSSHASEWGFAEATVVTQPPSISGLVPDNGPEAGGNSVVISGANLTGATHVSFGANAATSFTVDNDGQITATAPAGTGTVDVSVTTSVDTSANTAADNYTYNPPAAQPPSISGLVPDNGPEAGGNSVVISGANLTGATDVSFGANAATAFTVDNDGQITATAPAGTGTVDVSVTTPVDTSANTAADNYTYNPVVGDQPTITNLFPRFAISCFGGLTVISGENFTDATSVQFGDVEAPFFRVLDDEAILAFAPPQPAGTVHVTVTGPGGTSEVSRADKFTYIRVPFICRFFDHKGHGDGHGDDHGHGHDKGHGHGRW